MVLRIVYIGLQGSQISCDCTFTKKCCFRSVRMKEEDQRCINSLKKVTTDQKEASRCLQTHLNSEISCFRAFT